MAHTTTPIVLAHDGALHIEARHLDDETIELAAEYAQWAHDPDHERELQRGGKIASAIEAEQTQRWEQFVQSCAPTFTSRADAIAFAVRFVAAIDTLWPQT